MKEIFITKDSEGVDLILFCLNVIEKQGCCPCKDIIESGENCSCPSKFAEKYECDPLELIEEATEILARKESLDYLLEAKLLLQEEIEFKVEHDNS